MGCSSSKADAQGANLQLDKSVLERQEAEELAAGQYIKISARNFILKNEDINKRYEIEKMVGSGGFGQIMIAKHIASQEKRAVKILFKTLNAEKMLEVEDDFNPYLDSDILMNEITAVKEMDHPSIIKMYEYYETEEKFFMVTELMDRDTLYDKTRAIHDMPEEQCQMIARQVLSCLVYMHSKLIIHRDLKPQNILLWKSHEYKDCKLVDFGRYDTLKLIDYGFSITKGRNSMGTGAGTPNYVAPETLDAGYEADCALDMWAFGCVMFEILSGNEAFSAFGQEGEMLKGTVSRKLDYDNEAWALISKDGKDFVQSLIEIDVSKRLNCNQAWDHPWLSRIPNDLRALLNKETACQHLENLKLFTNAKPLQRAVHAYIACQLLSKQESISQLFCIMDTDGMAALTHVQLHAGFVEFCGHDIDEGEVHHIIKHVNTDGTGLIKFSEFLVAAAGNGVNHSQDMLRLCFSSFDVDNQDGTLCKSEMIQILSLGCPQFRVNNKIIDEEFGDLEEINFEDFCRIVSVSDEKK